MQGAVWQPGKCCSFLFKECYCSLPKAHMQDFSHGVLNHRKKGGEGLLHGDFYIKHFLRTN